MDKLDYFIKLPVYWVLLNSPLIALAVVADRLFPGPWVSDTPVGKLLGGAIGLPLVLWFLVASPSISSNAARRNAGDYEPFLSALVSALYDFRIVLSGVPILGSFFRPRSVPTADNPVEPE